MNRCAAFCYVPLLALLHGCCTSHRMVLDLKAAEVASLPGADNMVSLVAGALKPLGFSVSPSNYAATQTKLAIFSLRSTSVPLINAIDVTVDLNAKTIRLLDYNYGRVRGASPAFEQVKQRLEQSIAASHNEKVHFQDLPCSWFGP